ncbi:MAG: hypothetical protein OES79_00260, partial [Planctomycetota bacterium]|nr:hypothetical protein [Planctomycetota bacterium]
GMIFGAAGIALICGFWATTGFTDDAKKAKRGEKHRRHPLAMSADEVFQRIDKDGDGALSKQEFTTAYQKHRQRMKALMERHRGGHGQHGPHGGQAGSSREGDEGQFHKGRGGHGPPHGLQRGDHHGHGRVVVVHHHYYHGGGGPRAGLHGRGPGHHGRGPGHHGWHGRGGRAGQGPPHRRGDRAGQKPADNDADNDAENDAENDDVVDAEQSEYRYVQNQYRYGENDVDGGDASWPESVDDSDVLREIDKFIDDNEAF